VSHGRPPPTIQPQAFLGASHSATLLCRKPSCQNWLQRLTAFPTWLNMQADTSVCAESAHEWEAHVSALTGAVTKNCYIHVRCSTCQVYCSSSMAYLRLRFGAVNIRLGTRYRGRFLLEKSDRDDLLRQLEVSSWCAHNVAECQHRRRSHDMFADVFADMYVCVCVCV
jgi:hypothetical protein